jgi:hypothetical protein
MRDASRLSIRLEGQQLVLAVTLKQRNAIKLAAAEAGMTVSAWVRMVVDEAACGHPLELAAAFTGLPLTAWVREMAACAAVASPLRGQLAAARRVAKRRRAAVRASRTRGEVGAGSEGRGTPGRRSTPPTEST